MADSVQQRCGTKQCCTLCPYMLFNMLTRNSQTKLVELVNGLQEGVKQVIKMVT